MNYIELIILGITLFFIANGALWGFIRGRNRSILRISIIIGILILCFIVKNPIVDAILEIEVDGKTLGDSMVEAMGDDLASLGDMLIALVKGVIGFLLFVIMFLLLKFLTLIIVYPILKIFVKKEGRIDNDNPYQNPNGNPYNTSNGQYVEPYPTNTKSQYKLQRGFGAIIGAIQGLVICIFIIGPIVCTLLTASTVVGMYNSISEGITDKNDTIQNDEDAKEEIILLDNSIVNDGGSISSSSGNETNDDFLSNILSMLEELNDSAIVKVYKFSSGWVYDGITKTTYIMVVTDEDGIEKEVEVSVSLDSVGEIIEVASTVVVEFTDLSEAIEELSNGAQDESLTSDVLVKLGNCLISIGKSLDNLSKDSKLLLDDMGTMIIDMIMEESDSEEANEEMAFLYDFKFSELDLFSIGEVLVEFAPYITEEENIDEDNALTDDQIDKFVKCVINNASFLELVFANLDEDISLDISERYYSRIKTSIDKQAENQETKDKLYNWFCIEK